MFIRLNEIIHNSLKRDARFLSTRRGQIAVLLIVVIAILLIFSAVVMNIGRVSQIKTMTMMASNQSTAMMASLMTSYAQNLYETQMNGNKECDGDLTICGKTNVFKAIAGVIVVALICLIPGVGLTFMAAVGMFAGMGSALVQDAVVSYAIRNAWNSQWSRLGPENQFIEQGIITGLQTMVDDTKKVDDDFDYDMDGYYKNFPLSVNEKIDRFNVLYSDRLQGAIRTTMLRENLVKNFQAALKEFVYQGSNNWGLTDPAGRDHFDPTSNSFPMRDFCDPSSPTRNHPCCVGDPPPAQCNVCCLPEGTAENPIRPKCCDSPDPDEFCGSYINDCPQIPEKWNYKYNYFFQNNTNPFKSFLETFGQDDENRQISTVPAPPVPTVPESPREQDVSPMTYGNAVWGTDFFSVYGALWDLTAYRIDLRSRSEPQGCFWMDSESGVSCPPFSLNAPHVPPVGRVDFTNCTVSGPPGCGVLVDTDGVTNITQILIPANQCYDPDTYPYTFWWEAGADQYCSEAFPYYANCSGRDCPAGCTDGSAPPIETCFQDLNASSSCNSIHECGTPAGPGITTPDNWFHDKVDNIRYGIYDFIKWADKIIETDPDALNREFVTWYPEAFKWINTPPPAPPPGSGPLGLLDRWRADMSQWAADITAWRTTRVFPGTTTCNVAVLQQSGGTLPQIMQCLQNRYDYHNNRITLYVQLRDALAILNGGPLTFGSLAWWDRLRTDAQNRKDLWCPKVVLYDTCRTACLEDQSIFANRVNTFTQCNSNCPDCFPAEMLAAGIPDRFADNYNCYTCETGNEIGCWSSFECGLWVDPSVAEIFCNPRNEYLTWVQPNHQTAITNCATATTDWTTYDTEWWTAEGKRVIYQAQWDANNFDNFHEEEERNMMEMYRYRQEYLKKMNNEAIALAGFLNYASGQFNGFLTNASVTALKEEYKKIQLGTDPLYLPPTAVYAWKTTNAKNKDEYHVVRVDARLPGRCAGKCYRTGLCDTLKDCEPRWPWIFSWSKNLGMTGCYALGDSFNTYANGSYNPDCYKFDQYDKAKKCFKGGLVGSRAIRYDSERDIALKFANKVPLWKFVFGNRGAPLEALKTSCTELSSATSYGAVMFNANYAGNNACYDALMNVLKYGVESQSCAEYFFHQAAPFGFSFKFVTCPKDRDLFK